MKHWKFDRTHDSYLQLILDVEGKSVNILTHEVLEELAQCVTQIEKEKNILGLAMTSGKPGGFIYGADIREFSSFKSEAEVASHLGVVHDVFNRLAAVPIPTVVGVEGIAVGGGLEFALCFDHIIATRAPMMRVGFPEITLGILPGYGGSGRAYRRVGGEKALEMMLTGKSLDAEAAHQAGLVDEIVEEASALPGTMMDWLKQQSGKKPTPPPMPTRTDDGLIDSAAENYVLRARPDHTPAPFAILDHVADNLDDSAVMSAAEKTIFPVLLMSPASDGLRRFFDLKDMVRKSARGDCSITAVHVIGAGVMGGDVAAVAAMEGLEVTLSDQDSSAITKALARAQRLYERRLKKPEKIAAALGRLKADPKGEGIARADLIIEAVAENPEVKKSVFRTVEEIASPHAILASNTSSIPLETISSALANPERLVGIHFFNPATVMPLVEIIWAQNTDQNSVNRAMQFAGLIKKLPIKCKSAPGFLVNRALLPYIYAGIEAMLDGVESDRIDQAMLDFGMPMGPIELADQIGLDVTYDAGLPLNIPDKVAAALRTHIDRGAIGRKSGEGFYAWHDNKAERPRADYSMGEQAVLAEKLLAPMIRECRAAVAESVVSSAEDADAGMILGTGFPAFRGGPLHWDSKKTEA